MTDRFSTSNAFRGRISPEITRWRKNSDLEDRVTLIFRLSGHTDPEIVAAKLSQIGVEPQSVGDGLITGNIASKNIDRILGIKDILSVEMPRQLSTNSTDQSDDRFSKGMPGSYGNKLPE